MATRRRQAKRSDKGLRRGGSGGANPSNDGRITDTQHEDAMRVLRAEYYQSVRGIADEMRDAIKSGEITSDEELHDRVHQTIDGSYWVIYTHANFQVLMCSDHHDAYSEDFGEPPLSGSDINWAALAFAALQRDVDDQMQAEDISVDNVREARRSRETSRETSHLALPPTARRRAPAPVSRRRR
jgi:hypothetical protein